MLLKCEIKPLKWMSDSNYMVIVRKTVFNFVKRSKWIIIGHKGIEKTIDFPTSNTENHIN